MARKSKIKNSFLKQFERKGEKRLVNVRNKRVFYLIVCEGEETEPNYFNALKEDLPRGILDWCEINIEGTGKNCKSLIIETRKKRDYLEAKRDKLYDQVWAVFDRDSFPPEDFDNAINSAQDSDSKIECAWSNEAFELWYLLHFNYYNTATIRRDYSKLIEKEMGKKKVKGFKYKKNSTEIYEQLKKYGNVQKAIKWAKKLHNSHTGKKFSKHNPCTTVYKLVELLLKLKDE